LNETRNIYKVYKRTLFSCANLNTHRPLSCNCFWFQVYYRPKKYWFCKSQ